MMMMMMNCFCGMVDQRNAFTSYFQPGPLSEILIVANLQHAASRIWTYAEFQFRLCWAKLCSSDNHYSTAPWRILLPVVVISQRNLGFLSLITRWATNIMNSHPKVVFNSPNWLNAQFHVNQSCRRSKYHKRNSLKLN